MTRCNVFRPTRLTAQDLAILAIIEPAQPPSRTALESMPAELRPILDPFPFDRNLAAERNLWHNRRLNRHCWTANQLDAEALRSAARLAGWKESAPDHYELRTSPGGDALAVLLIRTAGTPTAALIVDSVAACNRYDEQHRSDPTAVLWNLQQ